MDSQSKSDGDARFSLRRLASRHAWAVVAVWLLATLATLASGAISNDVTGDPEDLLPIEHRSAEDRGYLLLSHGGDVPPDELLALADRAHEALGAAWIPIAAPSAELSGWLDAHALYLLPTSTHPALQERLSDDNIRAAVESLRARMSSPFFGLTMAESRRDPLRLRDLTQAEQGRAAWDNARVASQAAPTPSGDLLAHDGRSLLMAVRSDRAPSSLRALVSTTVGEAISVSAVGPRAERTAAQERVEQTLPTTLSITLAGITIILAAALRRVRQAVAILLCLASGAALAATLVPLESLSAPLLVLGLGFACEGALHLQRISERGWPGAAVLGTALLPLWLSPYPLWKTWSVHWLIAIAIVLAVLRVVLPALQTVLRCDAPWKRRGFLLRPMPIIAVIMGVGLLGSGAWATRELNVRGADHIDLGNERSPRFIDTYFDPGLVAYAHTPAETPEAALVVAASDAAALADLMPVEARAIDSPGSFVLPQDVLMRRRASLAKLELNARLGKLRTLLEARGFRPDAFGEFLRSASDPDQLPTPEAALDGPLARWILGYVTETAQGVAIEHRIHLTADRSVLPPKIGTENGDALKVHGPAIGGREQARELFDWLGAMALGQLWLAAFVVWIGTRSLPISMAAALAGLSTQTGMLAAMIPLGVPLSPAVIPVLLLSGAAASIAAGRACRSIDGETPLFATGLLVVSTCQGVAGLALVASTIPLWSQLGAVASVGAVLASGTGLFMAPGLVRLLRRPEKDATA